jgi:hypothetical protein
MDSTPDPSQDSSAGAGRARSGVPLAPLSRALPFPNWWPILAGVLVGLALRLIFSGAPGGMFTAMGTGFIYLSPIIVGAVTVYVAESKAQRSWSYYFWAPMLANSLFAVGTMAILLEGLICVVIIWPLFCLLGALGGLAMGVIGRATVWRRKTLYGLSVLPLVLGTLPDAEMVNPRLLRVERAVVVSASAEQIWQQIHNAKDIRSDEVGHAWMYRIGVPLPIAGVSQQTPTGWVRRITMGKSIHFDQIATDWQANRHVRWTYRFEADSFPPHALDDHVKIGGHYFDLIDTEYLLTPVTEQQTQLHIRMHYRVSTQFNWYAAAVANLLIGNFEEVILNFYQRRATQATRP